MSNTIEPILPPTRKQLRQLVAMGKHLGWKRSLTEVIADLSKPLPHEYLSIKILKGEKIIFFTWHTCNLILDYVAPGWQMEVSENQIGECVTVKARLTLLCAEGMFARSSLGSDELDDQYFGGPLPDAESQAMKRAAARFGLGLYLYDKAIINNLKKRL